jgi:aspartokinase-like uncharacterized kinase
MSRHVTRVIKLGGSLLDWKGWPDAFRGWLNHQPVMNSVLIVGGGALADAIRRWDVVHHLAPGDAHWLAIGSMALSARLAAKLLPEAEWTDDWQSVVAFADAERGQAPLIFDVSRFLKTVEPKLGGETLPQSWDVTSDSIAARIAQLIEVRELVLLKTCRPPSENTTLDSAADSQYVDRAFPRFAASLPCVSFVNLREQSS